MRQACDGRETRSGRAAVSLCSAPNRSASTYGEFPAAALLTVQLDIDTQNGGFEAGLRGGAGRRGADDEGISQDL